MRRCVERAEPLDVEFRTVLPDGATARWLRAIGRCVEPESGRPREVHGVLADVGPQKRMEADRPDLLRRLAEAEEHARGRLARDLHDEVGQIVTGLTLGLKVLERTLAEGAKGAAATARRRRAVNS
jgi:signal transduction histidine kinase